MLVLVIICGNNTTGVENTGIGQGSLPNNTTGNFNTSLGSLSLYWPKFSSFYVSINIFVPYVVNNTACRANQDAADDYYA